MYAMDERVRTIEQMRSLGERFITGEVTFDKFTRSSDGTD